MKKKKILEQFLYLFFPSILIDYDEQNDDDDESKKLKRGEVTLIMKICQKADKKEEKKIRG